MFKALKLGYERMCSRWVNLFAMVVIPIGCTLFFLTLLQAGLPTRLPVSIVDNDHSTLSRSITRSIEAQQLTNVVVANESYEQAIADVRSGRTFGFFAIPANFERDVVAGKKPTVNYYCDMTYFVPGTFAYKGFKTIAVGASAAAVAEQAQSLGVSSDLYKPLIQPMSIDVNAPGNPWTNYSYYLTPSFSYGVLALMIIIMTIVAITIEIKNGTSRAVLANAGGSITLAVTGKLLPQTVVFTVVGWCIQALMFGFWHFPCNGSLWAMVGAMPLFVIANQGFGLFWASVLPNPRLALSVGALIGILSFSITGFSFPVPNMYGAVAIFSYIVPVRYLFLINTNVALNGFPIYFSRLYYVAMLIFPFAGATMLWNLKKAYKNQVYVP